MITNSQKNSLLVSSQLPEFVRDNPDYANFVVFLQAYYEWMEQTSGVSDRTRNLLNYKDVDETTSEFMEYFTNDFLPYFPKEILVDKAKAVKIARELYNKKGTPASYQFLFRTIYNSDFEYFNTKDVVFKASSGTWYIAKSLRLSSSDVNFLNIKNYRLFGETSKSIATVEASSKVGNKIEIFISNIERLFESGEFVRVVDNNNQDVLFGGAPLRAKIVGQISQIKIDPENRGLLYEVGDPVIVYDGLSSANGVGAVAEVGSTTKGSIQRINVQQGGFGYTPSPQTLMTFTNAPGAEAVVGSFNPDPKTRANVANIPIDSIALKRFIEIGNSNYQFSNIAVANVNTTLANAFTFTGFTTYPLSSILVTNGGGGITRTPRATAISTYEQDSENVADLASLGILAPIQIVSGGTGYLKGDIIRLDGGSGVGATANVVSVAANGQILSVGYTPNPGYPLGGMGYSIGGLPTATVIGSDFDSTGAEVYVPGILGAGASFSVIVDRAGSISTINLLNAGEDYASTPKVSLKVQDILVTGLNILTFPQKGDVVYQGTDITLSSYQATVNSVSLLIPNNDPEKSLYNLRVFDYNSNPDTQLLLKIDRQSIEMTMANTALTEDYNEFGYRNYGDGSAKANASFLNGLTVSSGQYLNTQGQPSSFDILQSDNYNNFTYQITVEKEISKYRDVLLNLLHPTGMKIIGRYALKSNVEYSHTITQALDTGHTLQYHTGYPASSVKMLANFTNKSNNLITFENLAGADLSTFLEAGDIIEVTPPNGPNIKSIVTGVTTGSNTVSILDHVWLTYSNVATVVANSGANVINITSLTGAYNIINNGIYTSAYPLKDIVYAGDKVLIGNNTSKVVTSVDYINGKIYVDGNFANTTNSFLSVNRTVDTTEVRLFGSSGIQYVPELATEDGRIITTEDDRIILLG